MPKIIRKERRMAFLSRVPDHRNARTQRFSLLLLPHDDVYFEDYSASMYRPGHMNETPIEGRLKVCASCLVFDPKDYSYPIYSFPHKDIEEYAEWRHPRKNAAGFSLETTHYTKMKEANLVKPWQNERTRQPQVFAFVPTFTGCQDLLARLCQLHVSWRDKTYAETQAMLREITRRHQARITFNMGWIEDLSEQIMSQKIASRVMPLTRNPGRVVLTNLIIYFQPFNNIDSEPVSKFHIEDIKSVVRRRYLLRDIGLEIFFRSGDTLYLSFESKADRSEFVDPLLRQPTLKLEEDSQDNVMIAWQNGAISNFDYLMYLNNLADRSFTDLAQYPVFPWVIKDYTSETLDLEHPETFRDLSKPMGAQNPERLQDFLRRYKEMPEPKFHYGTHYSTPGYVLFYTLRAAPEYSLNLQNGKFDAADRLFRSVADTWNNACTGMADVKELIPEFYMQSTDFLLNRHNLDLGVTQRGERVADVTLPPWADSADDFLAKCRQALECDYVSQHLHEWIDLIFGYKQTGPEAVRAHNLFYYLTYEGEIDLDSVSDPAERKAFELQIMEFGQTPRLLFSVPHPQRSTTAVPRPLPMGDGVDAATTAATATTTATATATPAVTTNGGSTSSTATTGRVQATQSATETVAEVRHLDVDVPLVVQQSATAPETQGDGEVRGERSTGTQSWSQMINLTHMATLPIHRDGIMALALSSDGRSLYSASQDSKLKIHDLESHQEVIGQRVGDSTLSAIAVFPDDDTLLLSSWDSHLYLYSVELGSVTSSWQAHHDAVSTVKLVTGDNNAVVTAVSASWDGSIKVWRLERDDHSSWLHTCVSDLGEHTVDITALAVHSGRKLAVSGDHEGHMAVWDLQTFSEQRRISDLHFHTINDMAFTPDGCRLITCCSDFTLKVVVLDSLVEAMVVTLDEEPRCLVTDGTFILVGCESGDIEMWDSTHRSLVQTFRHHKAAVRALAVAQDASCVVSGDDDSCFTHWLVPDCSTATPAALELPL